MSGRKLVIDGFFTYPNHIHQQRQLFLYFPVQWQLVYKDSHLDLGHLVQIHCIEWDGNQQYCEKILQETKGLIYNYK